MIGYYKAFHVVSLTLSVIFVEPDAGVLVYTQSWVRSKKIGVKPHYWYPMGKDGNALSEYARTV